jgi:hypothetical protein
VFGEEDYLICLSVCRKLFLGKRRRRKTPKNKHFHLAMEEIEWLFEAEG